MDKKFVGKCIVSSLILNDTKMNDTLGSYALMRDDTKGWEDLREFLSDKGFNFITVGDSDIDWEIRNNSIQDKSELYDTLKNFLIDYIEKNDLVASEDGYNVGIGNQLIFTLQSK